MIAFQLEKLDSYGLALHEKAVAKAKRSAKRQERSQNVPESLARNKNQAQLRDGGACQARLPDGQLCGITKWVHIHHVKEKSRGGTDELSNLITLCSSHHRLWQRGLADSVAGARFRAQNIISRRFPLHGER